MSSYSLHLSQNFSPHPYRLTGVSLTSRLGFSQNVYTRCCPIQSNSGRTNSTSNFQRTLAKMRRISAYARLGLHQCMIDTLEEPECCERTVLWKNLRRGMSEGLGMMRAWCSWNGRCDQHTEQRNTVVLDDTWQERGAEPVLGRAGGDS